MEWANLALARYRLRAPEILFLRHSDNITFEVTAGARKYLLRLHKPLTKNFEDMRQQPQVIESELAWMDALRRQAHIPVPPAIAARSGKLVPTIILPENGQEVPCSLLGWVDGMPYEPGMENEAGLARQLGRVMALLHNHASIWQPPEHFTRPRYGADHVRLLTEKLSAGVQMGVICPEDFATLNSLADAIHEVVAAIRQTPENYSLIHNDLHTGNWLRRGTRVIPIDFSLCAYGYHLFDIAICAGSLGAENPILRRLFIKGYRELNALEEGYERALEAFFLISVLGYYTFILPDPTHHEWLYERLPRMLRTYGQKFLRAEPFFFEG